MMKVLKKSFKQFLGKVKVVYSNCTRKTPMIFLSKQAKHLKLDVRVYSQCLYYFRFITFGGNKQKKTNAQSDKNTFIDNTVN